MNGYNRYLVLAILLALAAPAAQASGGHGQGHHDYHGRYHGYRGGHGHHHHGGRGIGYAVGGLIAGGVLASVLNNSYYQPAPASVYQPAYPPARPLSGPVFIREANGLCYLQSFNHQGYPVLSPAPLSNCE